AQSRSEQFPNGLRVRRAHHRVRRGHHDQRGTPARRATPRPLEGEGVRMSTLTQDHVAEAAIGPVRVVDRSRRRKGIVLSIQAVAIVALLIAWQIAGSERPLLLSTPGGVVESVGRAFENGLGRMMLISLRNLL